MTDRGNLKAFRPYYRWKCFVPVASADVYGYFSEEHLLGIVVSVLLTLRVVSRPTLGEAGSDRVAYLKGVMSALSDGRSWGRDFQARDSPLISEERSLKRAK